MNKTIVMQFTALTFFISLIAWGICAVFGLFGFTIENAAWLWIFIAVCALSPTIVSYIVLKKNDMVKSLSEWAKNIFALKSPFRFYLLVVLLIVAYFLPSAIISGMGEAKPFYMFFVLLPAVLLGGGMEEAGWSYVLRPELDKQFGFVLSSVIVGMIWTAWHIPVFLPQGRIASLSWFGLFSINCIGLSFALGAIMKITKSVWLCVLFHTLNNAVSVTLYEDSDSPLAIIVASSVLIVVSITSVLLYKKKKLLTPDDKQKEVM